MLLPNNPVPTMLCRACRKFLCNKSTIFPLGLKVCWWHTGTLSGEFMETLSHLMVFVLISRGITITFSQALNAVLRFQGPYRTLWHFLLFFYCMSRNSLWLEEGAVVVGGGSTGLSVPRNGQSDVSRHSAGILRPLRNAIYGIPPRAN